MVKRVKKEKKRILKKWLAIIGLVFFCGLVVKIGLSYQKRIWQRGRLNFVFAGEPILVLSLSPKDKSLTIIKIPANTYLEVTRGYGFYRASAVYPLGELEGRGGQLLAETVQEFLGRPIEGYIRINSKLKAQNSKLNKEEIIELKKEITSWGIFLRPRVLIEFLKEDLKTNFCFWDELKIWLNLKKIKPARIELIDLDKAMVLEDFSLPDQEIVKKGDPVLIDNLLKESFFEPEIRKENISIKVLNGTNHSNLAEKAARLVTNLGAKVDKVGDSEEKVTETQIKANQQAKKSFTLAKIKEIFAAEVKFSTTLEQDEEEIILIIGEDYYQKLFLKE